jgi:predicted nucleotidyltransferase
MNKKDLHIRNMSQATLREAFPFTPILVGYRGSIAHGMFLPNTDPCSIDDKDIMGVVIAPLSCYMGLSRFETKETAEGEFDVVTYELVKYVRLLCKSNPNVLSLLWLDEQHYIYRSPIGQRLIDARELFVSKKIYHSFTGYAYGQLKRMEHCVHQGYMGEKRKALVEQFGFDTKNAAHLIRLLRMGIEFLTEGVLYVHRQDAPQLLEIKRGLWTLDKVKAEAERLFKRAEDAYDRSPLRAKPEAKKIDKLLQEIFVEHFDIQNSGEW